MRIIKQGQLPEERVFRGTCHRCKTEFECTQGEGIHHSGDQRDGEFLKINCPHCGYSANAYPVSNKNWPYNG